MCCKQAISVPLIQIKSSRIFWKSVTTRKTQENRNLNDCRIISVTPYVLQATRGSADCPLPCSFLEPSFLPPNSWRCSGQVNSLIQSKSITVRRNGEFVKRRSWPSCLRNTIQAYDVTSKKANFLFFYLFCLGSVTDKNENIYLR